MLLTTKELLFFLLLFLCFPLGFFLFLFFSFLLVHYVICYNPYSQTRRGGSSKHCCYSPEMPWVSGCCKEQPAADFKVGERKHLSQGHGCSLEPAAGVCRSAERTASQENQVISW